MDQWENVAEIYDDHVGDTGDDVHQIVMHPPLENALGDYAGKTIVDFGSGNGYYDRMLAQRAKFVLGMEKSKRLLDFAKKRGVPENVRFIEVDLEQPLPDHGQFDIGLCTMTLQYMTLLDTVAKNMSQFIKPRGLLIAMVPHPAFDNPHPEKTRLRSAVAFEKRAKVKFWSRPLKEYVRHLESAGFTDAKVKEISITPDMVQKIKRWQPFVGLPRFAVITMRKA